ncbi:MAG TPA: alpha/beta fold hydrolase [Conexibacter sp.]|nr:alpha/beta fold hydrolase [Conexibacter sp.]
MMRCPTMTRRRVAVALATLAGACAAAAPTAASAAPLAFAPCREKAQRGWECATLTAPLDHTGAVPGTVSLRVQRLAHDGPPRGKALVNVEGGPGGSTTHRSAQTRQLLGAVTAKHGYELILLDARATGASRPYEIALGTSRFYATGDTVRDLELVRQGLGIEKLALMGTSYSTLLAAEYARTFPERTDRLILDSPMAPDGPSLFGEETVAAALPALRDLCRTTTCPGGAAGVVRDLRAIVRREQRGLFWVPHPSWMPWRDRAPELIPAKFGVNVGTVLRMLTSADESTALFALLPSAIRDAARGDWRAFTASTGLLQTGALGTIPINPDVNRITRCLDARVPWPFEAPAGERPAALKQARASVATGPLEPFGTKTIVGGPGADCVSFGPAGLPGAIRGGPVPAVPGVILQGAWDLRTPPANGRAMAAAWPSGTLVVAAGTGHGVLRSSTRCATAAVDALLGGRTVDRAACADAEPVAQTLPVARNPADLRALKGAPRAVARTAAAVVATLRHAEVLVAVGTPRGGTAYAGGVEQGWAKATRTPPSLATTIALHDYGLMRDLALDGEIVVGRGGGYDVRVTLGGRHSGRLEIAGGRLSGTIDGSSVSVRLPQALGEPAVKRYG